MSYQTGTGAKRLVPWIVYLIFFAVLNETVFNVSTPMIAREFSLSPAALSWMMTSFMVFFGIGSVIYGKLSDMYSLRSLILFGIILYNAGSLAGFALRSSYAMVIVGRALQGMGGSAIPALIFVVVARSFAPESRGKLFGLITSTVSLAIGIGPVIGGFVSAKLHWSYLFLIPLLLLVSIPFLARELPREPRRSGAVDVLGALLVAAAVGALVVFLNFGAWYELAAFLVLLFLFVLHIRRAEDPFIKPSLFENVRFRSSVIVTFCLFSVVIGLLFLIPLMLSAVQHLGTSRIGLVLFPGAMSSIIFGPIGGRLADRKGNSFVVAIGLGLLLASILVMAFWLSVSAAVVGAALLLTYVGFALFQTAMVNSVSQTLPAEETGMGMGLFNLVGIMSGAVGTAVIGRALAGGWLDFALIPAVAASGASVYGNLMLASSLVVVLGGALYLRAFRGMAPPRTMRQRSAEG